jgi:hypothetical protein
MLLAPSQVLDCGLAYFQLTERAKRWNLDQQEEEFHKHFGSLSSVIATIWSDLLVFSALEEKEKGKKGCGWGCYERRLPAKGLFDSGCKSWWMLLLTSGELIMALHRCALLGDC